MRIHLRAVNVAREPTLFVSARRGPSYGIDNHEVGKRASRMRRCCIRDALTSIELVSRSAQWHIPFDQSIFLGTCSKFTRRVSPIGMHDGLSRSETSWFIIVRMWTFRSFQIFLNWNCSLAQKLKIRLKIQKSICHKQFWKERSDGSWNYIPTSVRKVEFYGKLKVQNEETMKWDLNWGRGRRFRIEESKARGITRIQ